MRIAMVSEHADPTAAPGGEDAGGQNVHVAALARALAARDHSVVVYTRLASPGAAPVVSVAPGVEVHRLPAGPPAPLPKDELLPHMAELGAALAREWAGRPPDLVHAHFWMSGLASLQGAAGLPIPVAQTFHALGSVEGPLPGGQGHQPAGADRRGTPHRPGLRPGHRDLPGRGTGTRRARHPRRQGLGGAVRRGHRHLLAVGRGGSPEVPRPAADPGPAGGAQGHRHRHRRAAATARRGARGRGRPGAGPARRDAEYRRLRASRATAGCRTG